MAVERATAGSSSFDNLFLVDGVTIGREAVSASQNVLPIPRQRPAVLTRGSFSLREPHPAQ